MSVIVWDGKSLAVDSLSVSGECRESVEKYKVEDRTVLTWAGTMEGGMLLAEWYIDGCEKSKWPEFQQTENWTILIGMDKEGVWFYEKQPVKQKVWDKWKTWGSGRDFALGALAMGASAEEAAKVACKFNIYCGEPIIVFPFEKPASIIFVDGVLVTKDRTIAQIVEEKLSEQKKSL